jgi:GNAT superfamily N-acetyltransferase
MAVSRAWRGTHATGPLVASLEDIPVLNDVFSEAFTERYRRDGLTAVRVPHLHPSIWRYAIEDAGAGALLWRDEEGEVIAFNMVHCSGTEGWMGPLAVRPDRQGSGLGKDIVQAGVEWLKARSAATIGLETMPRTMDNIGFYSGLGFLPMRLTITLTLDAVATERTPYLLGVLPAREKRVVIETCRTLADEVSPGADYSREIEATDRLEIGDTILLWSEGRITGFALCHTVPLVEGRPREEMRVLKMVLERRTAIEPVARMLCGYARQIGAQRVAFRVQGGYSDIYATLIGMGARVRWTDLRMTLEGYPEPELGDGLALSNWEI